MVEDNTAEAHQDHETTQAFEKGPKLMGGAAAGFVATIIMSIPILIVDIELVRTTIAGMYGFEGVLAAGIVVHLLHGAILGVVFAAVLSDPTLTGITQWIWKTILVGVVYGLILALLGTGIILPVWLEALGFAEAPEMPWVTEELIVWHIVYGVVLGGLFPVIENQFG